MGEGERATFGLFAYVCMAQEDMVGEPTENSVPGVCEGGCDRAVWIDPASRSLVMGLSGGGTDVRVLTVCTGCFQ